MKITFWNRIKSYFIAGLIALLPLWVTYLIARLVFRFIFLIPTSFAGPFLKYIPNLHSVPYLLNVLSLIVTVLIIIFLGMLLTNVVGRRFFLGIEAAINRIPLLSWVYSSIRKLTALFYSDDGESQFKRVVMIEYPRKGIFVIGFLTTEACADFSKKAKKDLVNIFLPTTPNPTSGFLLLVPKEDVQPLEISTEDAVKLIVSGGVATPKGAS